MKGNGSTIDCIEKFAEIYHRDPEDVAFCPYRVCPMGAHSDHQLGKITGLAIDKGIHIAYGVKKNGVVTVDAQDKILRMTEKVPDPETHWASVAFYYYPREAAGLIQQALAEGCGADAPGSFLSSALAAAWRLSTVTSIFRSSWGISPPSCCSRATRR